jgi:NAD(P)-dependent dehydrogenase (short-subunit alcohol dehydrogenase family)
MSIIITGSSGGIGSSIQSSCIAAGFDIISLNRQIHDLKSDIYFNANNINGLIYCAGINNPCEYNNLSIENIKETMQINCFSFVSLCKSLGFNQGANILAIGSLYSTSTKIGRLAYTMSKHAMLGAIKTLALEMAPNKIKVNMISPGFVLTPMTTKNNTQNRINELQEKIPLGITMPQDIADICVFFLKQNKSITGQNIIIDGGYSLLGI